MLSEKEVEKIAALARIELSGEEKNKFRKELSAILDYIDQLDKADTDNIEPLYQTTGLVNSTREDKVLNNFPPGGDLDRKLIGQAPHKQSRFIKVKSVLKAKS